MTYASAPSAPAAAAPYAGWPQRVGGYLIDAIAFAVPYFIGFLLLKAAPFLFIIFLLAAIGVQIYNRWYLGGTTGQTWGKKALGLKLVSEKTGEPIGMLMAFVRDIAHIADSIICYIGWLFPLWDAKRQTLGDKIMSTVVVTV